MGFFSIKERSSLAFPPDQTKNCKAYIFYDTLRIFLLQALFLSFCEKILWETGVFSDAGNAKAKAALTQGRAAFFRFLPFCCPADNRIANGPNHGETDWGAVLFLRRKRGRFLNCFFLTTPDFRQSQQQNGQQKQGNHVGNQQTCAKSQTRREPGNQIARHTDRCNGQRIGQLGGYMVNVGASLRRWRT